MTKMIIKYEDAYSTDLLRNLAREIEEAISLGMKYKDVRKHFDLQELERTTKTVSDYIKANQRKIIPVPIIETEKFF